MGITERWNKKNSLYLIAVCMSTAVFVFLYGMQVLDGTYTDWLMAGGDLSQHYLGWQFFRFAPWQPQIGMMNTIAYPYSESVIFTDSIPGFCIIFKLLRSLLPGEYQFFGWWGLVCFVLQGVLAVRILTNYLKSRSEILLGTAFFLLTPVFISRMYWHSALAAHFLILLAILFFVEEEKLSGFRKSALCWGILGMLAAMVHLYFLAMCGAVLVGFLLKKCMKREWAAAFSGLLSYLLSAAALIWLLGGFSSGMDDGAPGLGYYSFNLNGFFHADGWSLFLPELPYYADGQYEGFSYLGFGILLLCAISFIVRRKKKAVFSKTAGLAVLVSAALLFAAASNVISFGDRLLVQLAIPGWMEELWAPFRSSGRLVWPVVYLLMLYGICGGRIAEKKRLWSVILGICLLIQCMDLSPKLLEKHREFQEKAVYEPAVDTSFLDAICQEQAVSHLFFMQKDKLSQEALYAFSDFAWRNQITINDFYFARNLSNPTNEIAKDFAKYPENDIIYVFRLQDAMSLIQYPLHYYRFGAYYAGLKEPLAGVQEVVPSEAADFNYVFNGESVENGRDENGVRKLEPGGCSYGPFLDLPAGDYIVQVRGSGLEDAYLESYSSGGEKLQEVLELFTNDTLIRYRLSLEEDAEGYEVKLTNLSGQSMELTGITIEKWGIQ